MAFHALGLDPSICRALDDAGYKEPTSIQSQAIPRLLAKQDVIASADTGTGKTAAFMLPALHALIHPSPIKSKGPRVLVLTPTRELATQVTQSARTYGKNINKLRTVSILGGVPYHRQLKDLKNFVDILVATPGRLLDHHREGRIDFSRLELLVLDEADRMLDMGFSEDVQTIVRALKPERQTVLFSATLGRNIMSLAEKVTRSAARIEIEKSVQTNDNISQSVLITDNEKHKRKILHAILQRGGVGQVIVFVATKRSADDLTDDLIHEGVSAISLHGDMRQSKRNQAIRKVRENEFQVMVATDVAARGIDIPTLTHVINYDIPRTAEDYTHRIGRTGRAGAEGTAMTFVNGHERSQLRSMEKHLGHPIEVQFIPGLEPTQRAGDSISSKRKPGRGRSDRNAGGGNRRARHGRGRDDRSGTQPNGGDRRPSLGDRRASTSDQRPSSGARRSSSGDQRSSSADRRNDSNDRRTGSGERRDRRGARGQGRRR